MIIKQVYRGGSEIGTNSRETRKLETGMVRQVGCWELTEESLPIMRDNGHLPTTGPVDS